MGGSSPVDIRRGTEEAAASGAARRKDTHLDGAGLLLEVLENGRETGFGDGNAEPRFRSAIFGNTAEWGF